MSKITSTSALIILGIFIVLTARVSAMAYECDFEDLPEQTFHSDLLGLEYANPYEDFARDEKNGKLRFVGLRGRGLYFPGMDSDKIYTEMINGKYEHWVVEGTGDVIMNHEHMRLIRIAGQYAQIYNELLIDRIQGNSGQRTQASAVNNKNEKKNDTSADGLGEMTPECKYAIGFGSIEKSDAGRDACDAIKKSDYGFIAIAGVAIKPPRGNADYTSSIKACKLIKISSSTTPDDSYEYNRRRLIARTYAKRYNDYISHQLENMYSMTFMSELDGFERIKKEFKWYPPSIGHFLSCNEECFLVDLELPDRGKTLLDAARWGVSYIDNTVEFDWNDFLGVINHSNSVLKKHKWLNDLKNESSDIAVKLYIHNLVPHFDNFMLDKAKAIWEREGFKSELYYQVDISMMEKNETLLDLFISKDGNVAVITYASLKDHNSNPMLTSKHWALQRQLYYAEGREGIFYLVIDNEQRSYHYSDSPSKKYKF